ncbi:related to phosphatidic acid-preferring phospholipase A1 [Rhynchosporium agropyri]|uniref:Related to phosphatidic acid-preferring phospholipase A1 n=1 Tax=Rhynchosporium agropyri TaxID=914238 RepID=A0A1E1JUT3_9HELO|nr:related to phosphatidic acid-preferring phospholipase A1 [Rhynchosporium agropyri]
MPAHTYVPGCHLAPEIAVSGLDSHGDIPSMKTHFFYASPLPIDDPLSAVPIPTGSDAKTTRHPPRPFSAQDNNALEDIWLGFSGQDSKRGTTKPKAGFARPQETNTSSSTGAVPRYDNFEGGVGGDASKDRATNAGKNKSEELKPKLQNISAYKDAHQIQRDSKSHLKSTQHGKFPDQDSHSSVDGGPIIYGKDDLLNLEANTSDDLSSSLPAKSEEMGTTSLPFLKFSASKQPVLPPNEAPHGGESSRSKPASIDEEDSAEVETVHIHNSKSHRSMGQAEVPVGVSRLHLVKMPVLQMHPIYWSPVHDIASVIRGTWFYKDTMCPVEPAVANQLEMGYRELRPWSQTWKDELNSAMEVGAAGEEKITHILWPTEYQRKPHKAPEITKHRLSSDPFCAARCSNGEASAEGNTDPDGLVDGTPDVLTIVKRYPNSQVIYKDARDAYILKPNLAPSAYYGRKPLQKIKRGMAVGVHCVRGFDWKAWEKLHPSKKSTTAKQAERNAPVAGDSNATKINSCPACKALEVPRKVTDLVLVIHGIGQKLSERVESFHFTHAINDFRRSINVELNNEAVHRALREDLGGVMVLPINWRANLSFEDGGPMKKGEEVQRTDFSLKDITPSTIPAVRNMISDVMLDIPFYMSHHKPKMIKALISEANRVYNLWCQNNPDFDGNGRVHIIAHSLGSVMALEVLSQQPTIVPKVNFTEPEINTKHFDFCTTNLFFVGSPVGFFLLLDKGRLIPRRSQGKAGAEPGDETDETVTAEVGTLGCLAVDNVYNVIAHNDPIAYRLNATIDPRFAGTLKNAFVPSATTGFFQSIGNAMRSVTPGVAAPTDLAVGQIAKPAGMTRLPSQLEMEVHDFTREEIAEKKFYLLNDCGQVDWFLRSGGGPLEIQYLNMLGAHSSYWLSPDFIRMIVIEVGRKAGRLHALPNMRAQKAIRKTAS